MTALPPDVVADLERENARLQAELRSVRDRQAASTEILRTIGSVSGNAEQSLYQIAETTKRLFEASSVTIFVAKGEQWGQIIHDGASSQRIGAEVPVAQLRIGGHSLPAAAFSENRQIHLPDIENVDSAIADWPGLRPARAAGTRTLSGTPLRHAGHSIGVLIVHRDRLAPFSAEELALLQNFADQAAIAIENARLFNETREALERQTATADILKVIASSPSDVQPVFEAIAESAKRLSAGHSATVTRVIDDMIHLAAFTAGSEAGTRELQSSFPSPLSSAGIHSRVARTGKHAFRTDIETEPDILPGVKETARARGYRSILVVPMLREGVSIGTIGVTRRDPGLFAETVIDLLRTFADQAVIAIENTRLFNETKEALERQTATADILKVIASSPSDVQPVFDAIAASANQLIGGFSTAVLRFEGDELHLAAFTPTNPTADAALKASFPGPISEFPPFLLVRNGETAQITDTEAEGVPPVNRNLARLRGYRSMLFTPLMSNGAPIGLISVTRKEPGRFAAHHVELVRTFADQAVIAIENVRLFDEVQAKTSDLSEALQQQTATADVLKVISRSAFDLDAVMNTLTRSASELCNADMSGLFLREGDFLVARGVSDIDEKQADLVRTTPVKIDDQTYMGRAVLTGAITNLSDVDGEPSNTRFLTFQKAFGYRSLLVVPLMREGRGVGVFALCSNHVGAFSQRQIELVQTFADQAVIAIENVRLFDEVQARTRDLTEALTYQTGSGNILKVIASSPTDVGPVLKAIVESACELCEADDAVVHLREGNDLRYGAHHGAIPVGFEKRPINRNWVTGRSVIDKVPVHLHDVLSAEGAEFPEAQQLSRSAGSRTILGVPLLRDGESVGAIVLRRTEVQPFSDKQIALLQTFADQAVIAIGNVRLFDEVQARTRELSQSLDELRTAQDRLVQTEKLASLGQLTAGIAHEIKNPLNFVNNFSALSAELTDELNDVLKSAALSATMRQEVDELTGLLKDNLEKVVQHGKRADSIVKNMLLHSREGSGDHRPADINALLDESLNLAYHGARAEKREFNVTLQRDFDEMAGSIEVFPQEITRVLLNLISNGFYAVTKRKTEIGNSGFEPVLSATTRNLGDTVEIRIRDNGTGIPAEVKEKMFNPFFTTKPAGEGTGLGLSMSHDIIVKQHGGRIDVETEPGQFTEFTIVLPRTSNQSNKVRGQT